MKRSLLYQVGGDDAIDFESLAQEVVLAEELGVDTVWLFPSAGDDGRFGANAPEIWLAGLASRTERIRLGWGLAEQTPPSRSPMRVAEQGASIDVASNGRLEVALVPAGALTGGEHGWQEGFRMLVEMWDAPAFSWTSERFEVRPVDVVPKPVQKPHPPIWVAGWSLDHAREAGLAGTAFLDLSGGAESQLELHRDTYGEARAEADPNDLVSAHAFGVAGDVEPGEAGQERLDAWERLGVDQAVVRAGPLDGGHEEAVRRIRALTSAEPGVH